jgi:phosphatidylglycerol---prolipoprotein diacylglyceryl transferase
MWVNNLNPTLLHLGPLEIRWYGLVYILGFFLGVLWLEHARKKGSFDITKDDIWDLAFYLMLGVIVGARLFEIFWEPAYYLSNPFNILKIWQGGMSFHGGFLGSILAAWLYCKKKKINFWILADLGSVPLIFALALGRLANFVNGELVGRVFNGSWCVIFPKTDQLCRHPSTLYAAGKRFIVLGWLLFLSTSKQFKPGFIFWNFVFWEGLGRIIVDFYRQDVLYAGFSLGQWFSLVMVIIAFWFFVTKYSDDWKRLLK